MPKIFMVEGSDFERFPVGGQFTMARALMKIFGNNLALIGFTSSDEPLGVWSLRRIDDVMYWFLAVGRGTTSGRRPRIPARLTLYLGLKRFKRQILRLGIRSFFTQAPEAIMATAHWNWEHSCFWFPGVGSALSASRYPLAGCIRRAFDRSMFRALNRTDVVLAAGDERAIDALLSRSAGGLKRDRLVPLPTFVDTSIFRPEPKGEARKRLGIPDDIVLFVNHGRIGRLKGWGLILDAFECLLEAKPRSVLAFVGDGEDRQDLEYAIATKHLQSKVIVTGFIPPERISHYLNAADVAVFGSYVEGWSAAMLEALACGKPLVSTEVSGVEAMIRPGVNGDFVRTRNPIEFAEAMLKALDYPNASDISLEIAGHYDLSAFSERLAGVWSPFRDVISSEMFRMQENSV